MVLRAVLFDFDGTVAYTEESRYLALNYVLKKYDLKILREDWNNKYRAISSHNILKEFLSFEKIGKKLDIESLYKELVSFRNDYLKKNGAELVEGFVEFYNFLKKKKIKMIICSGGTRKHLQFLLEKSNFLEIDFIARDDYDTLKPSPECYVKGLEILKVSCYEAVVFDDSVNGIKAGIMAGCRVVGVNCEMDNRVENMNLLCKIKNFKELDFEKILNFDK